MKACYLVGAVSSTWHHLSGCAVMTGTAFFDYLHGQTAAAANGVQLHPALRVHVLTCARAAPGLFHDRRIVERGPRWKRSSENTLGAKVALSGSQRVERWWRAARRSPYTSWKYLQARGEWPRDESRRRGSTRDPLLGKRLPTSSKKVALHTESL
jgi:hypothetical protein